MMTNSLVPWREQDKGLLVASTFKVKGASLVLLNSLVPWREPNDGLSIESKDGGCGPLRLFSNDGLVVNFLEINSNDF